MINNIISRFSFNQDSQKYSRHCNYSFRLGYVIGCIYANKKIENKFNYQHFEYIKPLEFFTIKNQFFDLLKIYGIKDDTTGIVLSYLSMIEGLKSGLINEIPELKFEWRGVYEHCNDLFLSKYNTNIKDEYLSLCDDKGAFLFLRKNEFEIHENFVQNVSERIDKRRKILSDEIDEITKFSLLIAEELRNKVLFTLKSIYEDNFLLLKLSSLVMFYTRVITGAGSGELSQHIVKEFKKINNLNELKIDTSIEEAPIFQLSSKYIEENEKEYNPKEDLDIKFNYYLKYSQSISHNLKNLKKDSNGNFISSEENNLKLINDFNKLIFDDGAVKIENNTALSILSYVDKRVRNLNM